MSGSLTMEEWRDLWSYKVDFLFASFAWVFADSYLLEFFHYVKSFGLAFIVAYAVSLLFFCLPIIMMELAVGQVTGRGPIQAMFNICPVFKGVGAAQLLLCVAMMSYLSFNFGMILLYIFYLFYNVTESEMPWQLAEEKTTGFESELQVPSKTLDDPGELQWRLIAAQGALWILVFLAVFAGVRWLGKVCYVTFFVPLIFFLSFLIYTLTKYHKADMIEQTFFANWDLLLDVQLWRAAFAKSFHSLGIGLGVYITFGSYNKRTNNLVSDSFLIVLVHVVVTVLELFAVMMFAGHFAEVTKVPPLHFPEKPMILQTMIEALSVTDPDKLWTAFFLISVAFLMLNKFYMMTLSVLACTEDALGEKSSRCFPRVGLSLAICCVGFLLSLPYALQSGKYATVFVNYFLVFMAPYLILFCELVAVAWIYCAHWLGRDIRQMVSNACCWVTGFCFMEILYILPAVPVFVIVAQFMGMGSGSNQNRKYFTSEWITFPYPITAVDWYEPVGWLIGILPFLLIPLFAFYIITKTCIQGPGITRWQRFKYAVVSPLRYEVQKPSPPPRYTPTTAPGYVLLPQAPIPDDLDQENGRYMERMVKISNI